ncbi:MAG: hypothetical protein QOH06_980 [Acidobacteriota bacterium]|jgi:hypothetical protein|nr:hypothetical protein [Acidobacteriota bacterium]
MTEITDDLLQEIRLAEEQLAKGQGVPHEEARTQVLESLGRASCSLHPSRKLQRKPSKG